MNIPSELIQNFITSEFTEAKLTSTGEYHFNSPFDTDDRKRRLYINKNDGRWIDFKAGISGNFISFVREYLGLSSFSDVVKYLVENYNFIYKPKTVDEIQQDNDKKDILRKFVKNEHPILFGNADNLGPFGQQAYQYVRNRKLDESYYSKLGYIFNPGSRYDKRIFIPFFEDGKLVYFITRTIDPKNMLRYLNADKLDSKEYVFNIDKINDEVIICEGTFDAMSITTDQAATCLLSADIGVKQMEKIFDRQPKTIIYVPDQDATGMKKMNANIKKLLTYCPYTGLEIYVFNVPKGCKDLNDMKIKTGKDYILKRECTKYGTDLFMY